MSVFSAHLVDLPHNLSVMHCGELLGLCRSMPRATSLAYFTASLVPSLCLPVLGRRYPRRRINTLEFVSWFSSPAGLCRANQAPPVACSIDDRHLACDRVGHIYSSDSTYRILPWYLGLWNLSRFGQRDAARAACLSGQTYVQQTWLHRPGCNPRVWPRHTGSRDLVVSGGDI